MKFFTDESGQKFEEYGRDGIFTSPGARFIRPVQKQWEVKLRMMPDPKSTVREIKVSFYTDNAAQLIKEAIEALMGHIMNDDVIYIDVAETIDKAKTAIRGGEK